MLMLMLTQIFFRLQTALDQQSDVLLFQLFLYCKIDMGKPGNNLK